MQTNLTFSNNQPQAETSVVTSLENSWNPGAIDLKKKGKQALISEETQEQKQVSIRISQAREIQDLLKKSIEGAKESGVGNEGSIQTIELSKLENS